MRIYRAFFCLGDDTLTTIPQADARKNLDIGLHKSYNIPIRLFFKKIGGL